MRNKRGIAKTLSWVTAVIAIFFIMILFVAASIFLSAKKESNEIESYYAEESSYLKTFLNSPSKEQEGILVKDLIEFEPATHEEHFNSFKSEMWWFMRDHYSAGYFSPGAHAYGFRFYGADEDPRGLGDSGKYKKYFSDFVAAGYDPPEGDETCFEDYNAPYIYKFFTKGGKKIVVCLR